MSHETGVRIAEVGFLCVTIAGIWLVAAEIPAGNKWARFRRIVAGSLLAAAGVLEIIAFHWGKVG